MQFYYNENSLVRSAESTGSLAAIIGLTTYILIGYIHAVFFYSVLLPRVKHLGSRTTNSRETIIDLKKFEK